MIDIDVVLRQAHDLRVSHACQRNDFQSSQLSAHPDSCAVNTRLERDEDPLDGFRRLCRARLRLWFSRKRVTLATGLCARSPSRTA